jgi:hypothetical protein
MVEKNQPQRQAAKKIEPQVTFGRNRRHGAAFLSPGIWF